MVAQPTWIGKTIGGRYRIDDLLGQGGMSAVYKAYDPNLKRIVAIKMIHSHLATDPRFLIRFEEEAAAVAQLRHPNIVQVFDFNHDGDLYYMVQEFIPGETLQERLRRLEKVGRWIPTESVISYVSQIASATGYAHLRGMIHRDIKPANIMITVQDQATLMDFGIVKITGGERHTATGAVVGTALYLSPELIRGEVPDPRADIYSLGVTLFEMVSGRPPYEADSAMTLMMMHLNDPVPDLRQLRQGVPENLVAVIEKAMQKDPPGRYQSMEDMQQDLESVLQTLPVAPGPTLVESSTPEVTEPPDPQATLAEPADGSREPVVAVPVPAPPIQSTTPVQPAGVGGAASAAAFTASPRADAAVPPTDRSAGEAGPPPTTPPPAGVAPGSGRKPVPLAVWLGGGFAVIIILIIGIFLATRGGSQSATPAEEAATATRTIQAAVLAPLEDTPTITETPPPSATVPPSATPTQAPTGTPTNTPTLSLPPTPTFPAGVPFSFIETITVTEQGRYSVEYDTLEFQEQLPGVHVHFFFDTVTPEQAGYPGSGPWILWGGPRPFDRYTPSNRPEQATQMCILVANPDHSVQAESGNCMILPDVNAVTVLTDTDCLAGADAAFPVAARLRIGEIARVLGISADEQWWNVANPFYPDQNCWLSRPLTYFHGDVSTVLLAESPPLSEALNPEGLFVEITNITLNAQNQFVVEYTTQGYQEQFPGTHIHFFFNNIPPENVGMSGSGNYLIYGGPRPFTGYSRSDQPAEADQMCALVANPDHSVIMSSGNCFRLP